MNLDNNGELESSIDIFSNASFNLKFSATVDGSLFITTTDGIIYNDNLEDLGLLDDSFGNFFFFEDFAFSTDGTKAYSANNTFLEVRQYGLPERTVEKNYVYSYFMSRIFFDENNLLFIGNINDFTGNKTIIEVVPID